MIPLVNPAPFGRSERLEKALAAGMVGPGPLVAEAEARLAELSGMPHAILTTSGTMALWLVALSIDRMELSVVYPGYGFPAAYGAFAMAGARNCIMVDVDMPTMAVDPHHAVRSMTRSFPGAGTGALIYLWPGGQPWMRLRVQAADAAADGGAFLIDDVACGIHNMGPGTMAAVTTATLSFSPAKAVTCGQGGAVLTRSGRVADTVRRLIDHGGGAWRKTLRHEVRGVNLRMSDVHAALLLDQLDALPRSRDMMGAARAALEKRVPLQPPDPGYVPLHNVVLTERPDELVDRLRARGVQAARQYGHLGTHGAFPQPQSEHMAAADCPNAVRLAARCVYLPFGPGLSTADAERVRDALAGEPLIEWRSPDMNGHWNPEGAGLAWVDSGEHAATRMPREAIDALSWRVGADAELSTLAAYYGRAWMRFGQRVRIDDFCHLTAGPGMIRLGSFVHFAPHCVLQGAGGIDVGDYCGFSTGCRLITNSDDYSGEWMACAVVPEEVRNPDRRPISIGRNCIFGVGTIILPGAVIPDGVATGAGTLVKAGEKLEPWTIYVGAPARAVKARQRRAADLAEWAIERPRARGAAL